MMVRQAYWWSGKFTDGQMGLLVGRRGFIVSQTGFTSGQMGFESDQAGLLMTRWGSQADLLWPDGFAVVRRVYWRSGGSTDGQATVY